MSDVSNINEIHRTALDRIDRSERNYKAAFVGAAIVEALFLGGYLLLADFSNRMHVFLLITTMAVYTILAFGLLALGAHMNRNTLRVLKAVELLGKRDDAGT
ncbi:MAG TPA: hypothetical protein VEQ40_06435 [Pyrinomonadaceae bacterium]|nr:hypothetical protein [Pyrinomonadaceae bacterium]